MSELQTAWREAEMYLDMGISVIPVRDKPQVWKGREYPIKSAYPWKKFQTEIVGKAELSYLMLERYDTLGFGLVCGKVSGNLEIIDVDVKNWAGVEARLFQDVKSLLPHVFEKLRIHQTVSNGYHLLYRVEGQEVPGNLKLAWKEGVKEAALETRGEGGYIVASSQMGYKVVKDNPIPTISWEERCALIAICEGYNEKKAIAKPITHNGKNDFYDENPFEHFNNSPAGEDVLANNGWKLAGSSNNFIWYTRPGKSSGVSASFNRQKRVYYVFTSSTELEPSKGYNPSTLLSVLQFKGDKKEAFKWLVDNGYGRVNKQKEKKVAENCARRGVEVPANFSPEAKTLAVNLQGELTELHPYGMYWEYDDEGKMRINREQFMMVAHYLGYRYFKGNVVKVEGYLIHKIEEREFQDALKEYVKEPDSEAYFNIANAVEAFMEAHGRYTMKRLPKLDESLILRDTKNTCYKFYLNGYLIIDVAAIRFVEYDALEMLIWAESVQQRNYNKGEGGRYVDFLTKAIGDDLSHAKKCLGFLAHNYKDETTGYIIVLSEQCKDPKDGGGSGKNVFCKMLEKTTTYTSKPGSQTKFDEKFFQSWNGQKIFCISDVPENFDFSFLKEPATGSFIWKKLFKDEVEVSNEDAPKFIVQTNFSYEITDGGLRRRIIPIEFTNFFTLAGGLDVHYGVHFPNEWSIDDWTGYDNFIAESVQEWLKANRKLSAPTLTVGGWWKQFKQTYGQTISNIIVRYWQEWIDKKEVRNDEFKKNLLDYYEEENIPKHYQPSSQKINNALREYSTKNSIEYMTDVPQRENGILVKYRIFNKVGDVPF